MKKTENQGLLESELRRTVLKALTFNVHDDGDDDDDDNNEDEVS
jgi:hypothetical protein